MSDLSSLTPSEVDAELARISGEAARLAGYLAAVTRVRRLPDHMAAQYDAIAAGYRDQIAATRSEAAPFEAEYARRGGWLRYFLVQNDGGHVHRGTDCQTCYPDTQYAWLIDLADCDEAAMVAEWGERACTVCFPNAPALKGFGDGSSGHARRTAAEREALALDKARKAAERAGKAITAPDGTPLRVGRDVLRTKVAAGRALSAAVQSYGWYGPTHPEDFAGQARQLAEALAAAGVDPAPIVARASRTVARDGGTHRLPDLLSTTR